MSQKSRFLLGIAGALYCVAVLATVSATAGEPKHRLLHELFGHSVPDCIGKWCCDDYCPKKEPCVCVPLCFGCDDYCSKQEPCVCVPLCFGCDDYCKKCPPKPCSGPHCQFLRCGPRRGMCGCANCVESNCDDHMAQKTNAEKESQIDEQIEEVNGEAPPELRPFAPVIVRTPNLKLLK